MGAIPALNSAVASAAEKRSDRRSKRRYPIALEVQYKVMKHRRVERLGSGRTLNISSGGVLFEADGLLPTSGPIELALNWPFLLHGSCGLKLVMRGRIVRTDEKTTAIRAEFHEFRTAGQRVQLADASVCEETAIRLMAVATSA
jgi:c-di-GMP-binding flagellar brake protein YcgR